MRTLNAPGDLHLSRWQVCMHLAELEGFLQHTASAPHQAADGSMVTKCGHKVVGIQAPNHTRNQAQHRTA